MNRVPSMLGGAGMMGSIDDSEPTDAIQIAVECSNLANMDTFSKSDPFVVAYEGLRGAASVGAEWVEIGRTEIVGCPRLTRTHLTAFRSGSPHGVITMQVWDNLAPHFHTVRVYEFLGAAFCAGFGSFDSLYAILSSVAAFRREVLL